ncbi:MAG: phospho-N-acetylmuramoyl-pentapeptide-transferase, partial [Chitinophagaceae bacterium]
MLYHLFDWLTQENFRFPGSGLFQFISFRVMLALILSLIITTVYGKKLIRILQRKQLGETVRDLGLAGEQQKKGTPTMGGIILILAIIIPTILLANLDKVYVRLMLLSTVWLGAIGFIDDYLKIKARRVAKQKGIDYKKTDADGLAGRFKIFGQVMLGIIVGATLYFNSSVVVKREVMQKGPIVNQTAQNIKYDTVIVDGKARVFVDAKSVITTIPFVKSHEFNYAKLLPKSLQDYTYILYIAIVIFIVTAVSNGANITDGLDGLATGVCAIIGVCLGIFAYVSGNIKLAEYLNIMYIPNLGELSIFMAWAVQQIEVFKAITMQSSRFAVLVEMRTNIEGNHLTLTFEYTTGDASGQNMVTFCTESICHYIIQNAPIQPKLWFIEGNYAGDKKATALSFSRVRGKKVTAEIILPK